jgi:hypothetical protein
MIAQSLEWNGGGILFLVGIGVGLTIWFAVELVKHGGNGT